MYNECNCCHNIEHVLVQKLMMLILDKEVILKLGVVLHGERSCVYTGLAEYSLKRQFHNYKVRPLQVVNLLGQHLLHVSGIK